MEWLAGHINIFRIDKRQANVDNWEFLRKEKKCSYSKREACASWSWSFSWTFSFGRLPLFGSGALWFVNHVKMNSKPIAGDSELYNASLDATKGFSGYAQFGQFPQNFPFPVCEWENETRSLQQLESLSLSIFVAFFVCFSTYHYDD